MQRTRRIARVISGGQTGADQGGLIAARELGIPTGGTAPQGWLTETGPQEEVLRGFGLEECATPGYADRTRANVITADGTLLIGTYRSGGSALTHTIAKEMGKPVFHLAYGGPVNSTLSDQRIEEFCYWLSRYEVRVLNVAGNRESASPGIREFTQAFLHAAFEPRAHDRHQQ